MGVGATPDKTISDEVEEGAIIVILKKLACASLFVLVLVVMLQSCGGGGGGGGFNFSDPNAPSTFFEITLQDLGAASYTGNTIVLNVVLRNPIPSNSGVLHLSHSVNFGPFVPFNTVSQTTNLGANEAGIGHQIFYPSRQLGVGLLGSEAVRIKISSGFDTVISNVFFVDNEYFLIVTELDDSPTDGEINITEDGDIDGVQIRLNRAPASNVTVVVDTNEGQVAPDSSTLVFNSLDFDLPQTVSFSAIDDAVIEGDHSVQVEFNTNSADIKFDDLSELETINIEDNDRVLITQTGGSTSVPEIFNGTPITDNYTVKLVSAPTANVTLQVTYDNAQVEVLTGGVLRAPGADALVFTPGNFSVAQTVTVRAVDDSICEQQPHSTILGHTSNSGDAKFDSLLNIPQVGVSITENERFNIVQTANSTDVNEDPGSPINSDIFTITPCVTTSQIVTIQISFDGTQMSVSPNPPVFNPTPGDPVTVTVTAVNDGLVEGQHTRTITFGCVSTDSFYNVPLGSPNNNILPLTVTITDP